MTFCTFFKLKRKSYMLFKSRLMNPHNNNSSSHGYLSDRNMWVCRGTQFSQNPRFPCLYFPCRQSVLSPLQTHPALQRAATAAKHQLRDGAARACWDGRRQRDTECARTQSHSQHQQQQTHLETRGIFPFLHRYVHGLVERPHVPQPGLSL